MIGILLLTAVFQVSYISASNYEVTDLREEVSDSWSLSQFSEMIRKALISSVPFPWETVEEVLEEDQVDIVGLAQQMITHELPLVIPVGLGLVLAILVPIITLFFCCCRCCCGCCGSKLSAANVRKQKQYCMYINAFIVVTVVGILSAMACCIPLSGNRLKTSPRLIFRSVNSSVNDFSTFLDNFIEDASNLTMGVLNTAIDDIKDDLDDLPNSLSDPVIDGARPFVDKIESKIDVISNDIDSLNIAAAQINSTVDAMILHSDNLQTGLNTINGLYGTIKTDCESDGKSFCGSLPDGAGPDAIDVSIDNSKLTDLAVEVTKLVAEANKVNLTEYSSLGNTTFEEVPNTVRNASQDAIDSVKETLDTVQGDLEPEIDNAIEAAKFDMDLSDTFNPLDENIRQIETYDQIIGTVFAVLGAILFAIAMTALLGLMFGILCTKKSTTLTQTGRTKSGSCGACLLMTSVGLAVFPLFLVLLLGSVLMLLGGNLTIICGPLQDLTVFKRLVDNGLLFGGDSLGEMVFNDTSVNLSVSNLFKTCRNNGTVYTGLNLESIMNLSSMFNADEFVPDLDDSVVDEINSTIKDISIVNTSLFDDLKSKLELPDMDLNIAEEIEDELGGIDLEGKAKDINDLADTIPDPVYADKYHTIGSSLQQLHDNEKVPLQQSLGNLTTVIEGLNSTSQAIKVVITDLTQDLDNLTNFIEMEAVNTIVQTLDDFLEKMKSVPDGLINTVLNALSTDIGRCKIIADVYDIVIASFCDHFLGAFNVLWASFYTGGMVCIILMVASCTVSKYFRRPDDLYAQQRAHGNITNSSNPSCSGTNVDLIYYRSLAEGDESNNANCPKTNHKRVHQKWRQRRRFITGPFSEHFFNIGENQSETATSFFTDNQEDENKQKPMCTVFELNSSEVDSTLPSFDGNSSQETMEIFDENQKNMSIHEDVRDTVDTEVEMPVTCISQVPSSIKHAVSPWTTKDGKNCRNVDFTHFPFIDDDFNFIPMAQLKTKSPEHDENEMKLEHKIQHSNAYELEDNHISHEPVVEDEWLSSYKIEPSPENNTSSPLVKYSSDNEKYQQEGRRTNGIREQTTFSNLGYIESDNGSDITGNLEIEETEMNADVPNLLDDTSKPAILSGENLTENKSCILNEMEFPVQKIICSLCRSVNDDVTRKTDKLFDAQPVVSKHKEDNLITCETVSNFRNSVCNSDIGNFRKSVEKSFQSFDNSYQNLTDETNSTCFKRKGQQMDSSESKHNSYESKSKLDIEVRPYRSLTKMRSPQSAFLFWKYVEENCPSNIGNSGSQDGGTDDETELKKKIRQNNTSEIQTVNEQTTQELFYCEKCSPQTNKILPQSWSKDEQDNIAACKEPERLVDLAVTAGTRAYFRDESETDSTKTSAVNEEFRSDP